MPIRIRNLQLVSSQVFEWERTPDRSIQTYSIRTQLGIFMFENPGLGAWDINDTVNDGMRDMDPLRSELARKGLRQCSKSKLSSGKGCEIS